MFKQLLEEKPIVHQAILTPLLIALSTFLAVQEDWYGLIALLPLLFQSSFAPLALSLAKSQTLTIDRFYPLTIFFIGLTFIALLLSYILLPTPHFFGFAAASIVALFLNLGVVEEAQKIAIQVYIDQTIEREKKLGLYSDTLHSYHAAESRNKELDTLETKSKG